MIYKKALAISLLSALVLTSGCSKDEAIEVPPGTSATDGDITIINGTDLDTPPTEEEKVTIKIGFYDSSASISAGHLLENGENGVAYENYSASVYNNADEVVAAMEAGEIDASTLSIDEAVNLCLDNPGEFKIAMVNSLFNYCIAQNSGEITDITNLSGKTIYVAENDRVGMAVLNKLIEDYGITGCTIETLGNKDEVVNSIANGTIQYALLQEPYLSQAVNINSNVTLGIDLYDSWFDMDNADIVTGCLVVSNDLAEYNEKAMIYFLRDYDASVIITRKNLDESAQLAEKFGLTDSAAAAKASIPGCSIGVVKDDKMVTTVTECVNLINSIDKDIFMNRSIDDTIFYKLNQ